MTRRISAARASALLSSAAACLRRLGIEPLSRTADRLV